MSKLQGGHVPQCPIAGDANESMYTCSWRSTNTRSACSLLRQLQTWHCPHLLLRRRSCSNRPISPTGRAHSSKPATRYCSGRMGQRRTDRQTDTVPLHGACSAHDAGSANACSDNEKKRETWSRDYKLQYKNSATND